MIRSKPITLMAAAAVVPLAALTLAACGGGGGNNATAGSHASSKPASVAPTTIRVANSGLGKVLVDSQGRTLYLFKKDSATTSSCTGACATAWPPLRTSGKPVAGSGVNASLLGTITRSDGKPQVTYNGHPLYLFVKDQKAGDTKGEGLTAFGGSWFAVSSAGKQVSPRATSSGGGSGAASPAPAPPAPKTAPQPAPQPAPRQAAPSPPKASPPSSSNGIPQNGGGDGDADNNGGPSDGDGGI